jgi:anti-sigma B factor antagonist
MAAPPFKVETGALPGLPGGVLIRVNGPIDAKSVAAFKAEMDSLSGRRIRSFVLEMGEVRYINSTGLAYLINLAESLQEGGRVVVLVNVQAKVKVILETMGLVGFLRIYPSPEKAVRELAPKAPPPPPPEPPPTTSVGGLRRLFRGLFGPPGKRRI